MPSNMRKRYKEFHVLPIGSKLRQNIKEQNDYLNNKRKRRLSWSMEGDS